MKLDNLRNLARRYWVDQGYGYRPPGGLISPVFPAEFNMSAGHQYVLPVLDSDDPLASLEMFFIVERCLRRLDLSIVGHSPYHLSLVEMAVAARLEAATGDPSLTPLVQGVLEFLDAIGLHRKSLVITCCGGGQLGSRHVNPDEHGREVWIRAGIPPSRILMIPGRRNLVYSAGQPHPVFGKGPRPAGLAYEIFWPIGGDDEGLVEIASINLYTYLQRGRDVHPTINRAIGVGFGLERLETACNGFRRVFETDGLSQLVGSINGITDSSNRLTLTLYRNECERLADRMRSIAFVIADGQRLDESPRARILSDLLAGALRITEFLGINFRRVLDRCLDVLESQYASVYPQLKNNRSTILEVCTGWLTSKEPSQ
jgi:alanyl-tRNA synthetase